MVQRKVARVGPEFLQAVRPQLEVINAPAKCVACLEMTHVPDMGTAVSIAVFYQAERILQIAPSFQDAGDSTIPSNRQRCIF
jgi:hypothetical protein